MEQFNIYAILMPIALGLIVLEIAYCLWKKNDYMNFQDSATNMGTAIGNQLVNLFVMFSVYHVFGWLHEHISITTIENSVLNFCILLVLFDFLFYWFHRHGHTINILWAAHMPHHTSEEFNLFVGVRASITQRLFSFIYMWPLVIIGFTPEAIYMASAVQLILAFWHHTKIIGKMPGFELIFNSPSYHRVHHGINEKYLDKNFGEIFIIWDKIFGTYAKEEEPVVYGSLNPVESWNPNKIYFHYWWYLLDDAIKTKSWWDKLRLWFMPLGWRPEDRRDAPRKRINAHSLVKYRSDTFVNLKPYLIFHIIFALGITYLVIASHSPLETSEKLFMGFLLWASITTWGGLLEGRNWAKWAELFRLVFITIALSYLWTKYYHYSINSLLIIINLISTAWIVSLRAEDDYLERY